MPCHGLTSDTSGTKGKKICAAPVIGNCLRQKRHTVKSTVSTVKKGLGRTVHKIASKGRPIHSNYPMLNLKAKAPGLRLHGLQRYANLAIAVEMPCSIADVPDAACCHFAGFYRCSV